MKLRKKLIGAKVFHKILNKYITIEVGNEELYQKLGMDVFTKPRKPKLQKNDKTPEIKRDNVRDDSNGTNDDK